MANSTLKKPDLTIGILVLVAVAALVLARPLLFTSDTPSHQSAVVPDYVKQQLRHQPDTPMHGIDVSHYQGAINWDQVAKSDISFAYIKATDGSTFQDPSFSNNVSQASKTTLKLGPYHFFEANEKPQEQLTNFLDTIKHSPLSLTPMVDVELTHDQPAARIKNNLAIFLQQLEQATGCKPIIYSYSSFWQTNIGPGFDSYPFWLADYAKQPSPPPGVKNWQLWQYSQTGKVPGIEHSVDLDVVLDGKQQLDKLQCNYQAMR